MSFLIETSDNITISIDKRIGNISQLFNTLLINYDFSSKEKLPNVLYEDVQLLISFCEKCNYTPFVFKKPLWISPVEFHLNQLPENIKEIYKEDFSSLNIVKYAKVADFYGVQSIEELILLKLYNIFSSKENIINYFYNENSNMNKEIEISKERWKYLKNKYDFYIKQQLDNMEDNQIESLCLKYFK